MMRVVLFALYWYSSNAVNTTPTASVAMAIQGGGFRALSSNAGMTAGLLGFVGKQQKIAKPTFTGTGLLKRFDTFSTVSGGSWFFAELVYSNRFHTLLEAFAANPQNGYNYFKNQWADPFMNASGVDPNKFDSFRDIALKACIELLGKADEDTIFTFQFILATGGTWNEFVKILLNSTASIDNATLNEAVDAWAQNKYWLADHTILLPTAEKPAILFEGAGLDAFQSVKYQAQGSGKIPEMLPAKFSVKLGADNKYAPFPYLAPTAAAGLESFEYKGVVIPFFDEPSANTGPLSSDLSGGALTVSALPVWGAAAASSAAFGGVAVFGDLTNEVPAILHADLTPWVSRAPDGASFTTGSELAHALDLGFGDNKKNIQALASNAVHGLIDAGYTDNSGLGIAVGAGATEVLAMLSDTNSSAEKSFGYLFTGGGHPNPGRGVPADLYPLFQTSASSVKSDMDNFQCLVLPTGTQFLTKLSVGTIHIVTTDNTYFGLTAGKNVTVHIVLTESSLNMGFFEKYVNYGAFAQEIAMAINAKENEAIVNNTMLPMFMAVTATAETTPALMV